MGEREAFSALGELGAPPPPFPSSSEGSKVNLVGDFRAMLVGDEGDPGNILVGDVGDGEAVIFLLIWELNNVNTWQ